jgi:hypothetical protein
LVIRAATTSDLGRLFELIQAMHAGSEYAARGIGVDETTARQILMDGVMRHGRTNNGATLLNVVEFHGKVEGFMLGILQRVYSIGNRLEAQDFWLYCTPKAPIIAAPKLIDAYLAWALDNPKVAEVKLSWTDAMGVNGAKLGKLYQRKGARRCGEIYTIASDERAREAA